MICWLAVGFAGSYGDKLLGPPGHDFGNLSACHFLGDSVRADLEPVEQLILFSFGRLLMLVPSRSRTGILI